MIRLSYLSNGQAALFESAKFPIVIGRPRQGSPVDLDLSPLLTVSRPHARIWEEGGQYWVEDLNSRRGTLLNGHEIKGKGKSRLQVGDKLSVGDVVLTVDLLEKPVDSQSTLPPSDHATDPRVAIAKTLDAKAPSDIPLRAASHETELRLGLLYELPLRLAKEPRLDTMLQAVVEQAVKVIKGASRGALLLVDNRSGQLVLRAHLPVGEPAVSMTLARRVLANSQAFIWQSGMEEPMIESTLALRMGTGMYAPLLWRDSVLGVICVDNPSRDEVFATEDLRLLIALAHYAAMAVAHQRASEEARRHAELTNRLFAGRFAPNVRQTLLSAAADGSLLVGMRQSHITVLISDIRGFTQLTARLGAQRMNDLLNELFPLLIEAIHSHEGTIERFVGDAIFAVFGSPQPDELQQEHAVRAALAMQAVSELMKTRASGRAAGLEIGVGIDCGEALHGFIGNAERLEYTVVGDPANFASRYCQAAAKGEILVSPEVHARVFNKFKCQRLEVPTKHEGELVAFRIRSSLS